MAHAEEKPMKKEWVVVAVIVAIILLPIIVKKIMKLGKFFAGIVAVTGVAFIANVVMHYKIASTQTVEYAILAACIFLVVILSPY